MLRPVLRVQRSSLKQDPRRTPYRIKQRGAKISPWQHAAPHPTMDIKYGSTRTSERLMLVVSWLGMPDRCHELEYEIIASYISVRLVVPTTTSVGRVVASCLLYTKVLTSC
ncbi:unnamed protein product [Ectocarpus sp. 4 AP-2014]